VEYGKAWQLQKNLFSARSLSKIDDVLVLTQHPPTYTIGRRGNTDQLLISEEELMRRGYSVYTVDRGGAITYHGPGQIVGYPILNMKSYTDDYYEYLRMLEEVMIRALSAFGIYAGRRTGFTGVWVNGESNSVRIKKIGSIGVRIVKGYTMHGFSLNVNNDLTPFSMIIPCNIRNAKMTSIDKILGAREKQEIDSTDKECHCERSEAISLCQPRNDSTCFSLYEDVEDTIVKQFANVFGMEIHEWKNALTGLEPSYPQEMITAR
jgi:lipoate-protein ligase B